MSENFFITPTTINNFSLNSKRSSEDSSLEENSVRQGCLDSIQMDHASFMGASKVTDLIEIQSLHLKIPTDILGTKYTGPAQCSPRTPSRYLIQNLKIASVVGFKLVGMIFTLALAIVILRNEYIVFQVYILVLYK